MRGNPNTVRDKQGESHRRPPSSKGEAGRSERLGAVLCILVLVLPSYVKNYVPDDATFFCTLDRNCLQL